MSGKKPKVNELLCVPLKDMKTVLDSWKNLVEQFNKGSLSVGVIKEMDDALSNIVQFTKKPAVKFTE